MKARATVIASGLKFLKNNPGNAGAVFQEINRETLKVLLVMTSLPYSKSANLAVISAIRAE